MMARSSTGETLRAGDYNDGGRIHGAVVRQLGAMVLDGSFAPGDILPREDELAARFGVSRTSLREAVKVLSAKGLLEARPRIGVRVRPREAWNLIDPVVLAWHPDLTHDRELMRSLVETRRIVEPAAAGLAAQRASAADLARIEAACDHLTAAFPRDARAGVEADIAFHRAVVGASGNLVLIRLMDAIEATLRAVFTASTPLMAGDSLAAHRDVLEHVRLRDRAGAIDAMNRLLDIAAKDADHLIAARRP